ncbi:hypothetical protein KR52_05670 [Synechococcus sp. KORDI-52]|nr:hypothetical protein KR52_05670 [Synechococcus sp. KORDI-52]
MADARVQEMHVDNAIQQCITPTHKRQRRMLREPPSPLKRNETFSLTTNRPQLSSRLQLMPSSGQITWMVRSYGIVKAMASMVA